MPFLQVRRLTALRGTRRAALAACFAALALLWCTSAPASAPTAPASAAEPALSASVLDPRQSDAVAVVSKRAPSIYAAALDESQELEGDEEEGLFPGPDPCCVPHGRQPPVSPFHVPCPGKHRKSDEARGALPDFPSCGPLSEVGAAPCAAVDSSVQILC